jgi:hypothetical protein
MRKDEAIYATHSNVVSIRGDVAYDENDNVVEYNETVVQAYINSQAYKQQRAAEYPSYADQFDTIFHQGIDAWKAQIQAVKTKYPKS